MASATIDLHAPYKKRVQDALNNKHLKTALSRSTIRLSSARVASLAAVDGQRLRAQTRQMKEYALRHLDLRIERNTTVGLV